MTKRSQAIFLILLSALFFSIMNQFVRLAGPLPTMQKALSRNLVSAAVAFVILMREKERKPLNRKQSGCLVIRALAGTAGLVCNFYAVDHMDVADATILNKLSPFFVVILSIFILNEKARWKELAFTLVAFAGAMLVARPTFSVEAIPALVGLFGGFSAGLAYTYVRKLSKLGVNNAVIVLVFSVFSCLVTLPFTVARYVPMTSKQIIFLLLCGCSAAAAQFCVTAAYAKAPGRDIAVYDYSQVVFAAVMAYFLFGEIPDAMSLAGYVLICGAALGKGKIS